MGKGDKKSKRGKIFRVTYGKRRPRKSKSITLATPVKDGKKENEKNIDVVKPEEVKTEKKVAESSKTEKVKTEKKKTTKKKSTKKETDKDK